MWSNSPSNAQLLFVHKQRMGICHMVKNVLRKPVLIGPLESDIVKVRDTSERATENKVYSVIKNQQPIGGLRAQQGRNIYPLSSTL